MYRGFGHMGSGMLNVWIIPIILIVIIAIAAYMIVTSKRANTKNSSKLALEILNMRLAKGEIEVEEYHRIKKNLLDSK